MGEMPNSTIVVLTGPKHVGKTSTGTILAHQCQGDFVDLDAVMEQQTGKNPRTLYREGLDIFRQAEAAALESVIQVHPVQVQPALRGNRICIIAAGGGLIDNEQAMGLLKLPGITIIYLDVSVETAWSRICCEGALPPFLDTANPQETHKNVHQRRAAAYKTIAHITIQGENKSPEDMSREIQKALQYD